MMDIQWEDVARPEESGLGSSLHCEKPTQIIILGQEYNSHSDKSKLDSDVISRLWFTYRYGFDPIAGDRRLDSDKGWGCMHRCGQMMLAESFIRLFHGRDWRWIPDEEDETYWNILKMFQDRMSAIYSIHSITSFGMIENKGRGEWLGPNTVAQVLKKLTMYDEITPLKVHVTNENGIIISEIKHFCTTAKRTVSLSKSSVGTSKQNNDDLDENMIKSIDSQDFAQQASQCYVSQYNQSESSEEPELLDSRETSLQTTEKEGYLEISEEGQLPPTIGMEDAISNPSTTTRSRLQNSGSSDSTEWEKFDMPEDIKRELKKPWDATTCKDASSINYGTDPWHPLLLVIPLRLGLREVSPAYFDTLKSVFRLPQSVGILGGRPSHAQWMIGTMFDDLICLDPHQPQPAAKFSTHIPKFTEDVTFHCKNPIRLALRDLDPSLALGFLCATEADFDQLCELLRRDILSKNALFEIHEERPSYLPPLLVNNRAIDSMMEMSRSCATSDCKYPTNSESSSFDGFSSSSSLLQQGAEFLNIQSWLKSTPEEITSSQSQSLNPDFELI